jgi:DsbC/DsbD-like thiol-disulfide interchange protein
MKILLSLLLIIISTSANAEISSKWIEKDEYKIRTFVVSRNENEVLGAVHLQMSEGWKTYWENPGDAGIGITLEPANKSTIKESRVFFPAPKRFVDFDVIHSFGYKHEVVFPFSIKLNESENKKQSADISFKTKFALCNEICIFEDASFAFSIPKNYIDAEGFKLVESWLAKAPKENSKSISLKIQSISKQKNQLTISYVSKEKIKEIDVFITGDDNIKFEKPTWNEKQNTLTVNFKEKLKNVDLSKKLKATLVIHNEKDDVIAVFENFQLSKL